MSRLTAPTASRSVLVTARSATTFDADGRLDEGALRLHLERLVDAGVGVLLASCGSGEGGALDWDELARVYAIGVEVAKGRALVASNQPEQFTARASIEHARLAADAGVDFCNVYGPYGLHGYRPTDAEYLRYFDRVLTAVDHPVSLCPHASLGYSPTPTVLATVANRYPQVVAIILSGVVGDSYFVQLCDALTRELDVIVRYDGSFNTLGLGARGIDVQEANLVPKTTRRYADAYAAGNTEDALAAYADLKRITRICERWKPSSARWIKMALRAFRLPGGAGGLREPYLMPDDTEIERLVDELLALHNPEIDELARQAGLA